MLNSLNPNVRNAARTLAGSPALAAVAAGCTPAEAATLARAHAAALPPPPRTPQWQENSLYTKGYTLNDVMFASATLPLPGRGRVLTVTNANNPYWQQPVTRALAVATGRTLHTVNVLRCTHCYGAPRGAGFACIVCGMQDCAQNWHAAGVQFAAVAAAAAAAAPLLAPAAAARSLRAAVAAAAPAWPALLAAAAAALPAGATAAAAAAVAAQGLGCGHPQGWHYPALAQLAAAAGAPACRTDQLPFTAWL